MLRLFLIVAPDTKWPLSSAHRLLPQSHIGTCSAVTLVVGMCRESRELSPKPALRRHLLSSLCTGPSYILEPKISQT